MAAALIAATVAGCAPPPSADRPSQLVTARSAAEQRAGDRAHPQILAQYGGAYQGPAADYVRDLGRRLAQTTEQPNAPWTFTLLDSPIVNAFALPGGYVYVTRGLVALANDEAELAGVIGHEIGHVTAGHNMQRQERSQIAQAGVLAAVLGAAVLGAGGEMIDAVGQLTGAAAQGLVASYSRAQELEADRLGVTYLARAGFDPRAQADFLRSMQAQDQLSARLRGQAYDPTRVDFFSTHPATGERIAAALQAAERTGAAATQRNREAFMRAIDGMTFGDSAEQGFVRGRRFVHPVLRFEFTAPQGFEIANAAEQVTMRGPRDASVVFDAGRDPGGPVESYVANTWAAGLARQTRTGQLQNLRRFTVNGLEAASASLPLQTNRGVAVAHLTAIRGGDGRLYRFFGLARGEDGAGQAAVAQAAPSFRRLTAAEAARERPWRL
ncbi:MAG: M48 family metalloprotease, partial [Rubrimonas sp.]